MDMYCIRKYHNRDFKPRPWTVKNPQGNHITNLDEVMALVMRKLLL